jgi:hypothetical protein
MMAAMAAHSGHDHHTMTTGLENDKKAQFRKEERIY